MGAMTLSIMAHGMTTFSIIMNKTGHSDYWQIIAMLSVVMLSVVILSVVMLNVVVLSVAFYLLLC